MDHRNKIQTWVSEFILLGLSSDWGTQISLFVFFLTMYFVAIVENFLILLIRLTTRLHTPMYFFLTILFCVNLCFANSIASHMLAHKLSAQKSISFHSCLHPNVSWYGVVWVLPIGNHGLWPLCGSVPRAALYSHHAWRVMSAVVCWLLGGWFHEFQMETIITFWLPLCHYIINRFLSETLAVLQLAYMDISFNMGMVAISGFLVIMLPCSLVLFSYGHIVAAILCIHSTQGCSKAFGTCVYHLSVVCMFLIIFTYLGHSQLLQWKRRRYAAWGIRMYGCSLESFREI